MYAWERAFTRPDGSVPAWAKAGAVLFALFAAIAGVVVDSGNFDFTAQPERFPLYNTPDDSYHGLVFGRDTLTCQYNWLNTSSISRHVSQMSSRSDAPSGVSSYACCSCRPYYCRVLP